MKDLLPPYEPWDITPRIKTDFNYWVNLYKHDPIEFEKQRNQLLTTEANKRSSPEKANRILSHINGINLKLSRIKNPIERCNQMQVIFWKQVDIFANSLAGKLTHKPQKASKIIDFPKR